MSTVYDAAHQLAKAIKEADEFKQFRELETEVKAIPSLKEMIEDFQKRQLELQAAQLSGKEMDQTKLEELQKLFEVISKDPKAAEFFQAEMRFNQLMTDVSKILGDAMGF